MGSNDMITFKLFGPGNVCRRIRWHGIPQLKDINNVADDLVQIPADKRAFIYIDSEGDHVDIKTSDELREAVRDSRQAGVSTLKIWIRPQRQLHGRCGRGPSSCPPGRRVATDKEVSDSTRPRGWPRGRCHFDSRCRGGLFGLSGGLPRTYVKVGLGSDFCNEWTDTVSTLLSHIFIADPDASETGGTSQDCSASGHKGKDTGNQKEVGKGEKKEVEDGDHEAKAELDDVSEKEAPSPQQGEPPAPSTTGAKQDLGETHRVTSTGKTSQDVKEPASLAAIEEQGDAQHDEESTEDYEIVDETDASARLSSPSDGHADEGDDSDADLGAKVKLLRDMGFNLPMNVARNMIEEMEGRMDLIVRALVANSK